MARDGDTGDETPTELAQTQLVSASGVAGVPERIGKYRVIGELGAGGIGVVYRARDPDLNRDVAVKVLQSDSARGHERLLREAQAAARLTHPNIVTVYEVGVDRGRVFIAMEYVDGGTLRQWLEREDRPERDIIERFAAVARGLSAAHAAGLVHRDLKPDNVLIGSDGRTRITDFGIVGVVESGDGEPLDGGSPNLTESGAILGTPKYMAPEQYRSARVDARADQFAFCVALFEALYGKHPFGGATRDELSERVRAGRVRAPEPVSGVGRRTWGVLQRGLAVRADDRYGSMDEVGAALQRTVVTPRRGVRAVATVGVLALTAAGVAVVATRTSDAPSSDVAAVTDAAAPALTPRQQLESLPTRRLVASTKAGIHTQYTVDYDATTLAYVDQRTILVRPLEGGTPKTFPLPDGVTYAAPLVFVPHRPKLLSLLMSATHAVWALLDIESGQWTNIHVPADPGIVTAWAHPMPDGDTALIAYRDRVERLTFSTGRTESILVMPRDNSMLAFAASPDNELIAFVRSTREAARALSTLEIQRVDGSEHRVLASGPQLTRNSFAAVAFRNRSQVLYGWAGSEMSELRQVTLTPDGVQEDVLGEFLGTIGGIELSGDGSTMLRAAYRNDLDIRLLALSSTDTRESPTAFASADGNDKPEAWTEAGELVFISSRDQTPGAFVQRVDAGDATPIADHVGQAYPIAGTSDIVVVARAPAGQRATVSRIHRASGERTELLEIGRHTKLDCALAAPTCVLVRREDDHLVVDRFDPTTGARTPLPAIDEQTGAYTDWALSPSGDRLALSKHDATIRIVDLASSQLTEHSLGGKAKAHFLAWGPDGSVYLTGMFLDDLLYGVGRLTGDGVLDVLWENPDEYLGFPTVSPDGRWIAFSILTIPLDAFITHGMNGTSAPDDDSDPTP